MRYHNESHLSCVGYVTGSINNTLTGNNKTQTKENTQKLAVGMRQRVPGENDTDIIV